MNELALFWQRAFFVVLVTLIHLTTSGKISIRGAHSETPERGAERAPKIFWVSDARSALRTKPERNKHWSSSR